MPKGKTTSDPYEGVRKRVAKKLAGFTADAPHMLDSYSLSDHRPNAKDFPVPELVLFMLRDIMGWRWQGHGEKVRWSVYGSVAGEPVVFELRKFGFTIGRGSNANVANSRIEGQLKSALKEVEKFLEPLAEHQVDNGDLLIINRFGEFKARYFFFRTLADKAYARAKKPARKSRARSQVGRVPLILSDSLNRIFTANREGFFYSTAMVDSYFSALEHRLVLLRAFTGVPLQTKGLRTILASKWDEKLKSIIHVTGNRAAEETLGRVRRIKERIRNPFAHGGVENDGGSLFFHLPNVGAIPANFNRFGDSVRFSFIPIEADDHAESCAIFDVLDGLLSTGQLEKPHRLMDAGIDPSFDAASLEDYRTAVSADAEALEAFIDHWGQELDRHANMDY